MMIRSEAEVGRTCNQLRPRVMTTAERTPIHQIGEGDDINITHPQDTMVGPTPSIAPDCPNRGGDHRDRH